MPLTSLPENNPSESLILKNKEGVEAILTPSKLERWLATSEKMDIFAPPNPDEDIDTLEQDSFLAIQFISRFGFKKPVDLIKFLKSPGGEATLSLIGEQLALIAAIEEEHEFQLREEEALHRRIISNLLLYLIYKKEEKDHVLRDLMQAEIDKLLHKADAQHHIKAVDNAPHAHPITQNLMHHYNQAAGWFEQQLRGKLDESKSLEDEMNHLEKLGKEIEQKYDTFDKHLNELTNPKFLALGTGQKATPEDISKKIDTLKEEIELQAGEITKHLENGDVDLARDKLRINNGLNLQVAMLRDMLAVTENKSTLFNSKGEKVGTFEEDFDFIIPQDKALDFENLMQDKQLVKEDGEYYLINAKQKLNDMTPEQKTSAHEAGEQMFQSLKLRPEEMMDVKKLVHHNKNLEQSEHEDKKSELSERSQKMAEEIAMLANQLTQIQAARANVENELKQSMSPTPSPTPIMKMTPMVNMPTYTGPRPAKLATAEMNIKFLTEAYRHMLFLMKNGPTEPALNVMRNGLTPFAQSKKPGTESSLDILNTLKAGKPIPADVMAKLLKSLDMLESGLLKTERLGKKTQEEGKQQFHPSPSPFKRL